MVLESDELHRLYWTMAPGGLRWSYKIDDVPAGSEEIKIATITKVDKDWERIFTFPNLEELTLHGPDQKQLAAISKLTSLVRLRICNARPKDINFISQMTNLRELVLEYVSGFSDLTPLRSLKRLRLLRLENLRGVADFEGLSGIESLVFLDISGTSDWNQPISDFTFLKKLPNLEVLALGWIVNKTEFPALLPLISLKKLKEIRVGSATFSPKEYALLQVGLPGVAGTTWQPSRRNAYRSTQLPPDDFRSGLSDADIKANHPTVVIMPTGDRKIEDPDSYWYDFLGKGVRSIRCLSPQAEKKRADFDQMYETLKKEALKLLETEAVNE